MHTRHTILLVDDDDSLLAGFRRLCRRESFSLLTARSAYDALVTLASTRVDVVISDQMMPGMLGTSFLARVRAEHPTVVSLLLTGHADVATVLSAINDAEVFRVFTKPCDPARLITATHEALRYSMLVQQTRQPLDGIRLQGRAPDHRVLTEASAGEIVFEVQDEPVNLDTLLEDVVAEVAATELPRIRQQNPADDVTA